MTVISFINPKGGTGKTTSALLLAEQVSEMGNKVAVIDCDPNNNIVFWDQQRRKKSMPAPFRVVDRPDAFELIDIIDDLEDKVDLTIVDLEGTADQIVTFALSRTDMSIIPFKPSPMEARQCARAVNLIQQSSKISRTSAAYRLLFTRANAAIRTYDERRVSEELEEFGLSKYLLKTKLVERAAYTRIFQNHNLLSELQGSGVSNFEAAVENAHQFATEVLHTLAQEFEQ